MGPTFWWTGKIANQRQPEQKSTMRGNVTDVNLLNLGSMNGDDPTAETTPLGEQNLNICIQAQTDKDDRVKTFT